MNHRSFLALSGLGALALSACGGGTAGSATGGAFRIVEASNGFGKLLPYSIEVADANGLGTGVTIEVNDIADLEANLTPLNGIKPPVKWKNSTELPNAAPGNHFVYVRFNQAIAVDSVLTSAASAVVDNNLVGNIQVVSVDPDTGETIPIAGRGFVGGKTYGSPEFDQFGVPTGQLLLEDWVVLGPNPADPNGPKVPRSTTIDGEQPGLGYPGTQSVFGGAGQLISPNVFVFVVDGDGDLTSHEKFPAGFQIQLRITKGTTNLKGRGLEAEGVASSTVGDDTIPPEVLVAGEGAQTPVIIPPDGEVGVDPSQPIEVFFTEPIQFLTIGELDDGTPPTIGSSIQVQFGPDTAKVDVPFTVRPFSVYDLTHLELKMLYNFPGSGPDLGGASCGDFSTISIIVNPSRFTDLAGNLNQVGLTSTFVTAEGPGLVNAPVTPDAVYVGRGGVNGGISVIDLNGFGQGPGNPAFDPQNRAKQGNSNFPNNPNVATQGSIMVPPLQEGSCTVDGGSRGPFTLAVDSSLNDILIAAPLIETVGDMALGHALDNTFNNGSPFGCQAGGGNLCAQTGLKIVTINGGGSSTIIPPDPNVVLAPVKTEWGVENLVSWAPHPNPPALIFPPLCLSPLIGGQEPTSFYTTAPPPVGLGLQNLLPPNGGLGIPLAGIPPTGVLTKEQNCFFQGPSAPQQNIAACLPYMMRQQIGNYLYVIDRARQEVVVLNSNRFTVLDRIGPLPDPTSFAMGPNLDFLAVTNEGADQVTFINVDPSSASFHQVVKTTVVGNGPTGIAWTSDNEDVLVCNTAESTMSIISCFNLEVRKVVRNQLRAPFDVAIVPRMNGWSFLRQTYFAFVLNQDGTVAIFESGPDGVNGWGFDDLIGTLPFTFDNPKKIAVDPSNLQPQMFVVHENSLSVLDGQRTGDIGGALTGVGMSSGTVGRIPLDPILSAIPRLRDIQFRVFMSIGTNELTGTPVDLAFDNLKNRAGLTNLNNLFSASTAQPINGKALIKVQQGGVVLTLTPQYIMLAVPNSIEGPGVVDVIAMDGGYQRVDTNAYLPGVQSIPATNVTVVADYMRQ